MRALLEKTVQAVLEAEMDEALGAGRSRTHLGSTRLVEGVERSLCYSFDYWITAPTFMWRARSTIVCKISGYSAARSCCSAGSCSI